ncbi:actin remodeling regulator NHS [Synchiropus picturatus]
MPFAKRLVEPQLLCRYPVPNDEGLLYEDLVSISNVALSRTLRQLSDLAKHAYSIFQELEGDLVSTGQRVRGLQGKISRLQTTCAELDPKQEAVPVSNLDVESKLNQHYQAPWHLQRNVFRPSTRPSCLEELHRQAGLYSPHQDPQQRLLGNRRRRVTISVSALPPMPLFPSPDLNHRRDNKSTLLTTFDTTRSSSPTECCRFSPWSRKAAPTDPDTDGVALGHRSKFPIPNTPTTLDKQTNWSKALPLPTPEERMKSNSQVINSCIIPINVTGVGFDRDASVRCSLVHSQSLLQRRRKLRRRRTVAGVPRQLQQDLDSDDSPGARERTVIVHASLDITPSNEELTRHHGTRDSGCQTEEFLIPGAPSRRRIRAQRGQGASLCLSQSAGNICLLQDDADTMFTAVDARLRTRSLPREGRISNRSDDEDELSPFDAEDFLSGAGQLILKDEEESADDQGMSDRQLGSLKFKELTESPERRWMERSRSQLPRKVEMGSCDMSSSSDTFSSPVHSVSAAGVLGGQMDHKDDHQSSSGNWSGSSSTCPSQTSETLPLAASPHLTGSSHCDSELSLNATSHANDDQSGFLLEQFQGMRTQRAGSFSSTAMDILEEVGVDANVEGEWSYSNADVPLPQDFSPEPSREAESSLGCPSFTSMATCESSFSDKPLSEKADTVSHYSVDTEGYYTSMHFDCGLKESRSFTYNYAFSSSDCGLSDLGSHMTLGRRCLSLRKPKSKPSPPKRSSSLRQIHSEGNLPVKKEPKISCGQQLSCKEKKLQLALSGSPRQREGQIRVWGVEGSSDLPDLGVFSSTDAHSFKDEGVVQSEYADLWLLNDLKSSDPYRSLSNSSTATGTTVIECIKSQESSGSQTSQSDSRATTPSLPSVEGEYKLSSPEKLAGLASPSSGYSSQSETPTSSFPSAFFPGPLSPSSGKRKPKVPERKSSLTQSSCKDAATSKKDLELPIVPPSHLDLSAFVSNRSSAYRTSAQVFHQSKPQPQSTNLDVYDNPAMAITPSVLHSVQLRSVSKEQETSLSDQTNQGTKSHQSFERVDSSKEELSDGYESLNERNRNAPDLLQSISVCRLPWGRQLNEKTEDNESKFCSSQSETEEPLKVEEDIMEPDLHSSPKRPDGVDNKTPEQSSVQKDDSEDAESSSASAESTSLDEKEELMAEDSNCKDSTSNESAFSPLSDDSRSEDDAVFLSPTKSRTTEDLFAMIHRSKRKVLGRKDSTEMAARARLGAASGITSPISSVGSPTPLASPHSITSPSGLQKTPGPIYRNVKKSSTSNEEFKLLLLKKGSRSDSSYRMSATEILRSPITPKSPAECALESQELGSPLPKQLQLQCGPDVTSSPFPKANAESFSPKSFPTAASSRQGRSRVPPPSNSSRYSMRTRLYSAPMQAISEGETENSDGSPHDDRSSQDSS